MKRRSTKNIDRLTRLTLLIGALCGAPLLAQDDGAAQLKELNDNWYRTELLVFVRDPGETDELWDPLPTLAYPPEYRYLLRPELADRRLSESAAYTSIIDARGLQSLQVPAPIRELLDDNRPDALLAPVPEVPDPNAPGLPDPNAPGELPDPNAPTLADAGIDPHAPDPNDPLVALPYALLAKDDLEFQRQAASLRRRGQQVLFHEAWWAPLAEAEATLPIALDAGGDPDIIDWPLLQGSVHIYRSRYLHVEIDLWLNTLAPYLPEGWQIPTPPLAAPSVVAATIGGETIDPWHPAEPDASQGPEAGLLPGERDPFAGAIDTRRGPLPQGTDLATQGRAPGRGPGILLADADHEVGDAIDAAIDADKDADKGAEVSDTTALTHLDYPWHHAITHRQARRMRSGEIHYLDHPVIGVIVKITPVDETVRPLAPASEREFRERHGLPVDRFPAPEHEPGDN